MDKAKLREAMKAVTAATGRATGGRTASSATTEKMRARLVEALTLGERVSAKGKKVYNAAQTAHLAARLLVAGGTVPEVVRGRFAFALAVPALREIAEALGCGADALVLALVAPAEPEALADAVAEVTSIVQPVDAVAPRRSGSRRG